VILARAPLRISLGGGGTDLPSYASRYGGFVLSVAIDKYVYVCVNRPAVDDAICLTYGARHEHVTSSREVVHDLVRPALQFVGMERNLEITSLADVPAGTGLGSSGAFVVALLTALHALRGDKVPTGALAEQAAHIEMDMAHHPVGKHDHFLASFGGIPCLEIGTGGQVRVTPLTISASTLEALGSAVLLFYTGITRSSGNVLTEQARDTQAGNDRVLDSLHRTKDLGYRIKEALEQGDVERFGRLLDEHWQNKKQRSGSVSAPQLDEWYELARANGALGGKIMGAGGGGFFMFCCPSRDKGRLREALTAAGLREMSYSFDFEGAKVVSRPADRASALG
jgi:D-glycero-alpha-D-manno-heptose-7-phosphate kinase